MNRCLFFSLAQRLFILLKQFIRKPYFGFIQGHEYLDPIEFEQISKLVGIQDDALVRKFEKQFADLIGPGEVVAFAAARMGFYELMRLKGISKGDEVILLGATCAVMVNAVLRVGATPVFSDIDPDNFGSSSASIECRINSRTRMIVAQHSFGIPCDIKPIAELAGKKNIFLLEDCALTLGSKVGNVVVGNFGDAALFSTDHSKPVNTLTGGLIYTKNTELAKKLRLSQLHAPDLSLARQKALWSRLLFEVAHCVPERYGRADLIDLFRLIKRKVFRTEGDFLSEDFGISQFSTYPYPAKLPSFLAAVGIIEIRRWPVVANGRKKNLAQILKALSKTKSSDNLPAAYKNKKLTIIPLRVAWSECDGGVLRCQFSRFVHVSWTWFTQPIVATTVSLESLKYKWGDCPVSERLGPGMINLPCVFDEYRTSQLISLMMKHLK